MSRKPIGEHIKKFILLKRQENKCANKPNNHATGLIGYECLLWKYQDGTFDDAGYEFDHIDEYCLTQDNHHKNIQALCPNCHSYKTKNFNKNKRIFSSTELDQGRAMMEVDSHEINTKKRRKISPSNLPNLPKKNNIEIIIID